MKIGKYIIVFTSFKANDFHLSIPYNIIIWYSESNSNLSWKFHKGIECKHIKPNNGIQYKILTHFIGFVIIKILNK